MVIYKLSPPKKASMAERFIRTLKTRLERYFTDTGSYRWVDVIQKLSKAINASKNRSTGYAPDEVNDSNRLEILRKLYKRDETIPICRFKVGDKVRIPLDKEVFDKGYSLSWTEELFTITKIHNDSFVCFYTLVDQDGAELRKKYYAEELNLVIKNDSNADN